MELSHYQERASEGQLIPHGEWHERIEKMRKDDFADRNIEGKTGPADGTGTERTVRNTTIYDIDDLAAFLEGQADNDADILVLPVDGAADVPAINPSLEIDEEEQAELEGQAAKALYTPPIPPASSLGELRANARLTVEDVAESVGLFVETIDYMEEDIPVVETPRGLLHALGDLYGYSAAQIDAVLRSQGSQGIPGASYKLRRGSKGPSSTARTPAARSFTQVLADTGSTAEQARRWLMTNDYEHKEDEDTLNMEGDLFA